MTTSPPPILPPPYGLTHQITDRDFIESNVLAHLKTYMPTYLAKLERQKDLPIRTYPLPRSYDLVDEFMRYAEDPFPCIIVMSPGLDASVKPFRDGEGDITAFWGLAVGAAVATKDKRSATRMAGVYGAAIRGLMLMIPSLQGPDKTNQWCRGVDWEDESYDDEKWHDQRQLAMVRMVFRLEVPDVVNVFDAPRNLEGDILVPEDPYTAPNEYPDTTVATTDVEIDGI